MPAFSHRRFIVLLMACRPIGLQVEPRKPHFARLIDALSSELPLHDSARPSMQWLN
jgi:hypothetical protein